MATRPTPPEFIKDITADGTVIDTNGHVNNVAYVQWMQDIAIEHFNSLCGTEAMSDDLTWVAIEHRIRYLAQAMEGDVIEVRTHIENFRRVRSTRAYKFIRKSDNQVLVRAETEWAVVDTSTGAPRPIPEQVTNIFASYLGA